MQAIPSFSHVSDAQVIAEVERLTLVERDATVQLIVSLAEFDARQLHLAEGFSSLFIYCRDRLRLSESAAYARIQAARASRRFPEVVSMLADGAITLTTVSLLSAHLTTSNYRALLKEAVHKSRKEVEGIVARLRPLAWVPTSIRKLPAPRVQVNNRAVRPSETGPAGLPETDTAPTMREGVPSEVAVGSVAAPRPAPRPVIAPLAPERFKLQMTISRETHDKLREAQNLLRHSIPTGDAAEIFDRAIRLLVDDLKKKKLALVAKPRDQQKPGRPGWRHIPAAVRREVSERDGGRCAFIGTRGRCEERGFLEFHHLVPFAAGGTASTENIALRCRAHNGHEAALYFG